MRKSLWLLFLLLSSSTVSAAVLNVPADQPTIQAGIDSAAAGDTVLVAPGIYRGIVDYRSKNLRLQSTAGPDSTFIRALPDDTVSAFIIMHRIDSGGAVFSGFTVDSVFHSHSVVRIDSSTACRIENSLFKANAAVDSSAVISIEHSDSASVINCTFYDNDVSAVIDGGAAEIIANIFADSGVIAGVDSMPRSCNCYFGSLAPDSLGDGSFIGDPVFCDTGGGDFRIAHISPCAPDNNACSTLIGAFGIGCYPYDGPVWHVAVDGNDSSGNGSLDMPFATVQRAVDAADSGDTVLIGAGTFVGPGNSGVNISLSHLTIAGNGRDNTALDANGNAVLLDLTADPAAGDTISLRHLTLTGAGLAVAAEWLQTVSLDSILIDKCDTGVSRAATTARHCVFNANQIAIHDPEQSYFDSCSFLTNRKAFTAGGGSHSFDSCLFDDNDTALTSPAGSPYTHFHINHSTARNGAVGFGGRYWCGQYIAHSIVENMSLSALGSAGHLEVSDCIIRNNSGRLFYRTGDKALEDSLGDTPRAESSNRTRPLLRSDVENLTTSTFSQCHIYGNTGPGIEVFASVRFLNTTYAHNVSPVRVDGPLYIEGSTFACNDSSAIIKYPYSLPHVGYITASIFAFNDGAGLHFPWWGPSDTTFAFDITCTDLFRNEGGDYINVAPVLDSADNLEVNPHFCDTANGDFTIKDISPCSPFNNNCDRLIGARGVGCQDEAPVISSPDTAAAVEHQPFVYVLTFTDPDGPDTIPSFENIPEWTQVIYDTLSGTPLEGAADTSFSAIVSDGFKADTQTVYLTVASVNDPPALDSVGPFVLVEGTSLQFLITAVDPEGDSVVLQVDSLPANAAFVDSSYGTGLFTFDPDSTQAGLYNPVFTASDGVLSDSLTVSIEVLSPEPIIDTFFIKDEADRLHLVRDDSVVFVWSYVDPYDLKVQTQCQIAIGIDTSGSAWDTWNPEPFNQSDTTLLYAGDSLSDGTSYLARLRVYNGTAWSDWSEIAFRLNTAPTSPQPLAPLDDQVTGNRPMLWVLNAFDSEDDPLIYEFTGFHDTDCVNGVALDTLTAAQTADSTGVHAAPSDSLGENCIYWWRARAFDGYEYSDPSPLQRFHVDGSAEPPTVPALLAPQVDSCALTDLLPNFVWSAGIDPDPFDTVTYRFILSDTALLDSAEYVDTASDTTRKVTTALEFSRLYHWRVIAEDRTGNIAESVVDSFWTWTLGDVDNSHVLNIADLTYLIDFLFRGGSQPCDMLIGDADGSCVVNVSDLTYLVDNLFRGGPDPRVCPDAFTP